MAIIWALVYSLVQLRAVGFFRWDFVLGAVAGGFVLSWPLTLFSAAIGYVMMYCLGLPAVLLWRRVRGGISGPGTVGLGAALGVAPILLVGWRHLTPRVLAEPYFWLFASCGAATAAVFWYVGLREPTAA